MYPRLYSPDLELLCRSTARRREEWPTLAEAKAAIDKNPVYKTWDPRTLAALKKYWLRQTAEGSIRTTSSKHQEIALIFMPNFHRAGRNGLHNLTLKEREVFPDIDLDDTTMWYPFWRPECIGMM